MNGIEIDFSAGFGEAGTDVPDLLNRAILVLVGALVRVPRELRRGGPAGILSGRAMTG